MYDVHGDNDDYSTLESGISSITSFGKNRLNPVSTSSAIVVRNNTTGGNMNEMKTEHLFSFMNNKSMGGVVNTSFVMTPNMPEWSGKTAMSMPFFQFWFDVLENDDTAEYKNIMKRTTKSQRCGLLNGRFAYDSTSPMDTCKGKLHVADYERPIFIAIVNASKGCVLRMIRDGVQVVTPEKNGCNIIHALVLATADFPEMERTYIQIYEIIVEKCNVDEIKSLHYGENDQNFRPIELAAKLGTWGIFRTIIESNMYEELIGQIAVRKFYRYNITDYENFKDRKRDLRSPLKYIAYMSSGTLKSFQDNRIQELPIIKEWIAFKIRKNGILLVLWFLVRVLHLCAFISIDPKRVADYCTGLFATNLTSVKCNKATDVISSRLDLLQMTHYRHIGLAVCFVGLVILLLDILEFGYNVANKDRRVAYLGVKLSYLGYTPFYRICQSILYTLGVAFIVVSFYDGENIVKTMIILKAFYLPFIVLSFMYFLELIPVFGPFTITLQKMMVCLLNFLCYTMLVHLLFTVLFTDAIHDQTMDTVWSTFYVTFLINIGMHGFGPKTYAYIQISHIILFYLCAILLVCYLIAVMSQIVTDCRRKMDTVQMIRRLDAALLVEERVGRWIRILCGKKKRIEIVTVKSIRMQSLDGSYAG